jgi:hypothetical protein
MALITISPMPMVSPRTVLVLAGSTHRAAFRERRLRMVSGQERHHVLLRLVVIGRVFSEGTNWRHPRGSILVGFAMQRLLPLILRPIGAGRNSGPTLALPFVTSLDYSSGRWYHTRPSLIVS